MIDPSAPLAPPDPGPPPPDAPRPIRSGVTDWNSNFGIIWGGGYGGIPAIVLCVLLGTMGPPWNDTILDQRGVTVSGTPYAVESTGVAVDDDSVMRVKLRFQDRAGRTHDVNLPTMNGAVLQQASQRAPMDIDYDPEDPSVARIHGQKSTILSGEAWWVTPMLLFVFIIPGLSALAWGVSQIRQRRRVYRRGSAALATVVEHTESASAENDEHLTNARYEFETPRGKQSGIIKALHPPPVGARLWVIYEPADPGQNLPA